MFTKLEKYQQASVQEEKQFYAQMSTCQLIFHNGTIKVCVLIPDTYTAFTLGQKSSLTSLRLSSISVLW